MTHLYVKPCLMDKWESYLYGVMEYGLLPPISPAWHGMTNSNAHGPTTVIQLGHSTCTNLWRFACASRDLKRQLSSKRFLLGAGGKHTLSCKKCPCRSVSLENYCELLIIEREYTGWGTAVIQPDHFKFASYRPELQYNSVSLSTTVHCRGGIQRSLLYSPNARTQQLPTGCLQCSYTSRVRNYVSRG